MDSLNGKAGKTMIDSHGRKIDYMRISITDRCNLRCQYCMPEELPSIGHTEILRFEEILEICQNNFWNYTTLSKILIIIAYYNINFKSDKSINE